MSQIFYRRCLFASACAGIFLVGIVLALLGTLFGLPEVRSRLHVNLAQQGDIFLLLYFGIFLATLIVGPIIDRFGNRVVLFFSSLLVTLALAGFTTAESFSAAALAAIVLGLGGGGLNTSTNVVVSDLYGEDRGAMLNLLGIFFGFGALVIPLLAASAPGFSTVTLLVTATALAACCTLGYALLRFPPAPEAHSFSLAQVLEVARYPRVLLFGFLLFFQSGNEASIGGWTSTYVGSMGWTPQTATWVLAGYWAALMIGRLLSAQLLRVVSKERLVMASGVASIAGCAVLLAGRSIPMMAAGAILIGLAFASIFPTTLAMAGDRYHRFPGTVFGLLFAVALIGGMLFPWAIGHLGQAFGVRSGMLLPLAGATMICVLLAVIRWREPATPQVSSGGK